MSNRLPVLVAGLSVAAIAACNPGSSSSAVDMASGPTCNPFTPAPECSGPPVAPLTGSRALVLSSLAIGGPKDGFDLNCDGKPDNKLSPLGAAAANSSLMQSFMNKHDIIIPIELFGYSGTDTDCTKFAFYLGRYNEDRDADGADTTWVPGKSDCDDTNPAVHPGMKEDLTNRIDDDCDGYADNATPGSPPMDTQDLDGDHVTEHDGDCDDRPNNPIAKMRHKGAKDICGNGIDEDCDGIADDDPSCDPFGDNNVPLHVQELSFKNASGVPDGGTMMASSFQPLIAFPDGKAKNKLISAGPDLFQLGLNLGNSLDLTLTLSGAHVALKVAEMNGGTYVTDGTLGGVLEVVSLAQIHIAISGILTKDQSLADGVFVGAAAPLLALESDKDGHYHPDIDVDGDGIESFWQENTGPGPDGGAPLVRIDTCKDGDGTIVRNGDNGVPYCPLAKDAKGNYRFVDGLSTALKFTAVPARLSDVVPH